MVTQADMKGEEQVSPKSKLTTAVLAVTLGEFGAHRFYIGKTGSAITMLLLSISGLAILLYSQLGWLFFLPVEFWAVTDFIIIQNGAMRDSKGRLIRN